MPSLRAPAPSSNLLRFLRSQSEGICFFNPNPRPGFTFDHGAPRVPQVRARSVKPPTARRLSTSAPRCATVEAGFLNLELFWPRSASSTLNPQDAHSHNAPRGKRSIQGQSSQASRTASLVAHRSASTGSRKWNWKLWGAKRGGKPLHPDDLPGSSHGGEEDSDTSMFSLGRHISAKAAAQPKLRCTEFDEHGNVVLASGEFKKSELIAKV